jgi:phage gp45-like
MVPTFAPATDDAADSDEVNVATYGGDEVTDDLPLLPTFSPATDDAAGSDGVNAVTGGDEEAMV